MWTGVFPAVTTKFTEDDRLDHAEMERCFQLLVEAGCDGLIVCRLARRGADAVARREARGAEDRAQGAAGGRPVLLTVNEAATRDGACAGQEGGRRPAPTV